MVKSLRKIRIDRPKKETESVGAEQLNVAVTPAALSSSGTEGAPHASLKSPTALLLKTGNHPLQQTPQLHPNISPPPNRLAAPSRQHQHRVAAYARRLSNQVWPLTLFFSVSFLVKKIIDLPGGQINYTSWGNTILFRSSQQLPRLRLGPLKGFLS